jgi:alpha-tubulin suppressor-like RCC1 family protein
VWGRISEGKLGMRAPESAYNMRDHARPGGPFVLPLLNPSLANVTEVVCRQARTMALTADGSVYSWGTCDNASLGHGDKVQLLHQPRKIEEIGRAHV